MDLQYSSATLVRQDVSSLLWSIARRLRSGLPLPKSLSLKSFRTSCKALDDSASGPQASYPIDLTGLEACRSNLPGHTHPEAAEVTRRLLANESFWTFTKSKDRRQIP